MALVFIISTAPIEVICIKFTASGFLELGIEEGVHVVVFIEIERSAGHDVHLIITGEVTNRCNRPV